MLTFAIYLQLLSLFTFFSTSAATVAPTAYTPTDYILVDCGASSTTKSEDQRTWLGDSEPSKFSPTKNTSVVFQASSGFQVPYMTARIFQKRSSYALPVSQGSKFLRLYFYPAQYFGLDATTSFFSVSVNNYTLLNNFSAYLTASAMIPPVSFFIKEFIVTIGDNENLNITFTPSPNSFAFANGIEVVSIPEGLYTADKTEKSLPFVQSNGFFNLYKSTAFETAYRLNVGGQEVSNTADTGMFRTWRQDSGYIYGQVGNFPYLPEAVIKYTQETPPYTAPDIVYKTSRIMSNAKAPRINLNFNLTWNFAIDSGFNYLVRLHFCETQQEVTAEGQRVFYIFINNQTAETDADVIHWSGGNSVPVYRDYVLWVAGENQSSQVILWLALHPNVEVHPRFWDVILNGVEIFKLNNSEGSLAGRNPELPDVGSTPLQPYRSLLKKKKGKTIISLFGGVVAGFAVLLSLVCFLIFKRRLRVKESGFSDSASWWSCFSATANSSSKSTKFRGSFLPSGLSRYFSLAEIKAATNNFDKVFIIGVGGFGNVYKGLIDGGATQVAIKRLNPESQQGALEFQTEIDMLSQLRHLHLVSLIGYCNDGREMILVYDFMAHGTLRDHLYRSENPPLPWKQRLEICIGAARGLHYLHGGAKHIIIHRDVKTTNILLDKKWVAKVSDFGLSKVGPTNMSRAHVSTLVKGSMGYLDPEYYRRQQLTEKSDVYSFGVVLCEVLCARPPISRTVNKSEVSLVVWAQQNHRNGTLGEIIDPFLKGKIAPECLKKFGQVAMSCLLDEGIERPSMNDVVWGLELALQLQESAEEKMKLSGDRSEIEVNIEERSLEDDPLVLVEDSSGDLFSSIGEHVRNPRSTSTFSITTTSEEQSFGSISKDSDRLLSSAVFSQIRNSEGR